MRRPVVSGVDVMAVAEAAERAKNGEKSKISNGDRAMVVVLV